jgi:hypothetical protein
MRLARTARRLVVGTTLLALAGCVSPLPGGDDGGEDPIPPSDADPLLMNISIHVEGSTYDAQDDPTPEGQAIFEQHLGMLTSLADAADVGDGVRGDEPRLTFELNADFVHATEVWGSTFIPDMVARGHGIGVHADVGGTGYIERSAFTAQLVDMREAIEAQGVDVTHVSGICSPSEWVEAAIDAGFDASTGMVEYCLSSYPGNYPMACGDWANECHGPAVTDWEHKLHPWHTSTSADWLTDDPNGELVLVAGESSSGVNCLGEDAAGQDCRGVSESSDADEFRRIVREYILNREAGRLNAFTMSWSVGARPTDGFAAELFASVADYVGAGYAEWSTAPAIAAVAN